MTTFVYIVIGLWISIALVEAAHALVGHLAGYRILEIQIGVGPTLACARMGGMVVRISLVPLGGQVIVLPPMRYSKPPKLAILAAGTAISIGWVIVLYVLAVNNDLKWANHFIGSILIGAAIIAFLSLLPDYGQRRTDKIEENMLGSLELSKLLWPKGDPVAQYWQPYLSFLRHYADDETLPGVLSHRSGWISWKIFNIFTRVRAQKLPSRQQLDELERELQFQPAPSEQLWIINLIAICALAEPGLRDNASLDRLTAQAMTMAPHNEHIQNTRGQVLAQLGRTEEALCLLNRPNISFALDRCIMTAFKALAYYKAGNKDRAATEINAAATMQQSENLNNFILDRITERIRTEIAPTDLEEGSPV